MAPGKKRELPAPLVDEVRAAIARTLSVQEALARARSERDEALAELLARGFTPGEIGRAVGMSRQAVREVELKRRRNRN